MRRFRRAQNSNWKRIKPSTGESKREREAQESRGDLVVAAGIAAFWEMEQGAKPELEAEGEEVEIQVKKKQIQCEKIKRKDQKEMDKEKEEEIEQEEDEEDEEEEDEELLGMPHSSDDSDEQEGKEDMEEEQQHGQGNSQENVMDDQNNGDNDIEGDDDGDIFQKYSSKGLCYYKEDLPILQQEIKLANQHVQQNKPIKNPDSTQQFQQLLNSNVSSLKHTIEQQELSRKNKYKNGKQSNLTFNKSYGYSGNTANKYVSSRKRRLHGDPDFESLGFVASGDDAGEDYDDDDNEENNQENSQDQEEEEEEDEDDGEEDNNSNYDKHDENHNINNGNVAAVDDLERNNNNNNSLNKPFTAQSFKKNRQNNDPQNHHEDKTDLEDNSEVIGAQFEQKVYYSSMQHSKSVPQKAQNQSNKLRKELHRKTNNFTNFTENANSQQFSTEYPEPPKKKKLKTEGNNNNNSSSSASTAVLNKEPKSAKKKPPQHSQSQDHSDEDYDDVEVTISDEQQHELLRYHKRSKNYFGTAKQFNITHQQARAIVKIHKVEFKNLPSY